MRLEKVAMLSKWPSLPTWAIWGEFQGAFFTIWGSYYFIHPEFSPLAMAIMTKLFLQ